MNVIFIIILGFVGYIFLFFLKKKKTTLSVKMLCISSLLTFFSLFYYGISHWEVTDNLSLDLLFSCLNGCFLLLLTAEKKRSFIYFLTIVLGLLSLFVGLLCWYYFFPENINRFKQMVAVISILSAVGFGSYGYLTFINDKQHTKHQEAAILFYVVLLFLYAFLFSSTWLNEEGSLMSSYLLFLLFNLCVLAYAFLYEGVIFVEQYQHKQPAPVKILKWKYFQGTNVMLTKNIVHVKETGTKKEKEVSRADASFLDSTRLKQVLYTTIIETELFLDHTLTLHKVAELTSIDKNRLNDYFKKSQSSSFKQYLNRLKVEHAINVIREREKDITVEELTVVCGFNTRLSFYRAFVYFYGFAPSELLHD